MRADGVHRRRLMRRAAGAAIATLAGRASAATAGGRPEPFEVSSADGTVLAGDARGEPGAPGILFVHGLRQSRMSWDKQFADPVLAGFRLVRFDLRGHGDSDKPSSPDAYAGADRWAEDVAAVIAAAGLRRPVLVGWSLGGYAVGAYLRMHGGARVAGVNLVDAVIRLSPELLTPLAEAFTRRCTSHDLAERSAATAEFLAACFHREPAEAELRRMLVVNGMTARAANEGFAGTTATDMEPALRAYDGPILLTHGRHDRLVRLAMSERIAAMRPDHRLSVFEDSGHSPFHEEPGRFNRELASFATTAARR